MRAHHETTDDSDSPESWEHRRQQAAAIQRDIGLHVALIRLESGERGFGLFVPNPRVMCVAWWDIIVGPKSAALESADPPMELGLGAPLYAMSWPDCASDLYNVVDGWQLWLMTRRWATA